MGAAWPKSKYTAVASSIVRAAMMITAVFQIRKAIRSWQALPGAATQQALGPFDVRYPGDCDWSGQDDDCRSPSDRSAAS